ncbi:MAG: efflux RND transporter permease subunit [Muribaculaceae bacterium]|nr:efflux RND transporter permease subunit [Muribaculaceae bacterium]
MIKFLIHRPIAVLMAYLALIIVGVVTFFTLPVSLLPDISIPHITVKITEGNYSARELETSVVTPVRRQLMQVNGLEELKSETRDGSAIIKLTLDYGVNTDFAFIEVNEKIDAAMNALPKTISRPKAVKASATDIPVVYVHVTSKEDDDNFLELSELTDEIVRRRLEQQPEVAMIDITGVPERQLRIVPNQSAMKSGGITTDEIEDALESANVEPGSMTVRDGHYEYDIHISNTLTTPEDVRNIPIVKEGRIFTIGDFCEVDIKETEPTGYSYHNGKRAVTMAVIKQANESMDNLEKAVDSSIDYFSGLYPELQFSKSRSQTQLLDFTISNLEQNLILGLILVFLVCALFMRSGRLPVIIGVTVMVAVVMTFLLFYLFHISINIISLAGLILAVGMMIDNSVIVAENITQYRQRHHTLEESCIQGTTEMITPMFSSSLTTIAVFVPLVFMSGIAGAIFADQAFAITAGLASSYVVGITLLPVLYFLLMKRVKKHELEEITDITENPKTTQPLIIRWYDWGINFVFSHKFITLVFTLLATFGCIGLFFVLKTERMPKIDSAETIVNIEWNENVNIDENRTRTNELLEKLAQATEENSAFIGLQDFLVDASDEKSTSEAEIYLRVDNPSQLDEIKAHAENLIKESYPKAKISFSAPENVFEKVFSSDEKPLVAQISIRNTSSENSIKKIEEMAGKVEQNISQPVERIPLRERTELIIDNEKLALYHVSSQEVMKALRVAFKGNQIGTLRSNRDYIPIQIKEDSTSLRKTLEETLVATIPDKEGNFTHIPLKSLLKSRKTSDFKTITAGNGGEYIPLEFDSDKKGADKIMDVIMDISVGDRNVDAVFTGSLFSNMEMMRELIVILLISLLLMYFILCAQFESFFQPLIVLIEIPIDVTFALISLWIFGQTLNVMSAIGIIVTCGIVVNDSILKIDAINELRKKGIEMIKAVHLAGQRRLKSILMTSLTTILAMVPVLFTSDLGSELQRPLAIAMIGSMIIGTLVSIFVIPLLYVLKYNRKQCVS